MLGQVLHETDRYDEAIEVLERALKKKPDNPEALNFYGVALKSVGRLDEAREYILKALKLNDAMYGAYANLNDLVDFSEGVGESCSTAWKRFSSRSTNPQAEPFLPLHFAYAKALDDRGQHEKALEHYIIGGKMKRAQLDYKEEDTFGFFDDHRAAFPKEAFENRKFEGIDDDRPVFIVGMPRSGSTLVEQILSSHPDVYGAGEVKYLSRALGQLRDRFPSLPKYPRDDGEDHAGAARHRRQELSAGAVRGRGRRQAHHRQAADQLFLPRADQPAVPEREGHPHAPRPGRHLPSGFTKLFKDDMPHSYDLGELGRYYGKYRELMEHWEKVLPEGLHDDRRL